MPKAPGKPSRPETVPELLPDTLLPELIRRRPLLICLDYDGTISEIAPEPRLARPVDGALETLRRLVSFRGRVAVAIVSGRSLEDLHSLFALPSGVAMAGVHGLELLDWEGRLAPVRDIEDCRRDCQRLREWLARSVPHDAGFVIEDKGIALALHYRRAEPMLALRVVHDFEQLITSGAGSLKVQAGKMVLEAVPKIATKANAVRILCEQAGAAFEPVYFGDDLTDEDAFAELADAGVAVLVGQARPSAARYRVDGPRAAIRALEAVAATLREIAHHPARE